MSSTVEILLSTYNGAKFLREQLDSIIQQDYPYWKLVIRDDGSTDDTLSIVNEYIQKYPGKIILLKDNKGNIGYTRSFTELVMQSASDFIMFCDQDDYWYPSKISTMLSVMMEEEVKLPGKAHIVFADLQMADINMSEISPSFLKIMGYSSRKGMQIFFLKNYVPGCNILFNRTLVQLALKTDNSIGLHDHWLLMVCSSVGKLTFVNKPLMKYRMHDKNAIGFAVPVIPLQRKIALFFKDCFKYCMSNKKYRNLLYSKNIRQMQNICEKLGPEVSNEAIAFSEIDSSFYISRKLKNIFNPYLVEKSLLKQLAYIICF